MEKVFDPQLEVCGWNSNPAQLQTKKTIKDNLG